MIPVRVTVNGKEHTLPEGATVADLLEELSLQGDGIAVAVDRRIVPRSTRNEWVLEDGQTVEVVRAVGGG
jgi:sulfur carrier protein